MPLPLACVGTAATPGWVGFGEGEAEEPGRGSPGRRSRHSGPLWAVGAEIEVRTAVPDLRGLTAAPSPDSRHLARGVGEPQLPAVIITHPLPA